jgi:uncharacterized protein (TIGR03437 family)
MCLLVVFCSALPIKAQPVDRAQLLNEIIALQNQIKNTTDPAQLAILQEQLRAKEAIFLSPATEDFAAHADFLNQPDTGLIRLLPREGFDGTLSTRGGGAYYSFTRLTHEYGYGSDLSLQRGEFSVGFAGADFGFLVLLGDVGLETVTIDHPGARYLATFVPPLTEAEAREQQRRGGNGFEENGYSYRRGLTALINTTYIVRSVQYEMSDDLVAFRFVRRDADGSAILLWKMLKWFATPQLRTGGFLASVSAATYKRTPLAQESIVAAFGKEMSAGAGVATGLPLPTALAGVTISIFDSKGVGRLAPLFAVSPNQINFQMPPGIPVGPIDLNIDDRATNTRRRETLSVSAVAPGLFTANADGQGAPAAVALRIKNGAQSYEPVAQFDSAQNKFIPAPIDLGAETDQVFLLLFGTGVRHRSSLDRVSVKIGGIDAPAPFAGAQGLTGLDQINVTIPRSLIGRGEVDLVLTVDRQIANVVRLNFQ